MSESDLSIELLPFRLGREKDSPHIRRKIVGLRPFRDGGIRLEAELLDGKHVIHCYGHGGSGWTLAPGCGARVADMLGELLQGDWTQFKGEDVTIVGAGVIGLFAAYFLSERDDIGTITIVAEQVDDLTSHNAGGLFEPFVIGTDPDFSLLEDSYAFYHALARGEQTDPDFDALDVELLSMFSNEKSVMPSLVAKGYIPDGLPATVCVNDRSHEHFVHLIYFLDVGVLMKHLQSAVTRRGVRIMRGVRLEGLGQAGTDLVINCSGLGAAKLAGDTNVRPVTGHLIRLQDQPRGLLDLEHNLHVMTTQADGLKAALRDAVQDVHVSALEQAIDAHLKRDGNVLSSRFADVSDAQTFLGAFVESIARMTHRLGRAHATDDPDIEGLRRIRLFDRQPDRNRFIDALSLLIRVAEREGAREAEQTLTCVYAALLPRASKRYVMLFEQAFPQETTSDGTGQGISYFMPVIDDAVMRGGGVRFHYADRRLDSLGAVGCCGGTSIDRTGLTLADHEREFEGVIARLKHLGFR